jgi:membrane protein YqaA with SNARE-associated domain
MNDYISPPRKPGLLRKAYDWMITHAAGPHAWWILGAVAFAESSFFPLPPDIMLVPMALANRQRAFLLALWCTFASVLGGMLGYGIGLWFYGTIGHWIITTFGGAGAVETFRHAFAEYGMWIILIKGATPVPYKIITILSGFSGYNFVAFVGLSIITRFVRFGIVAALIYFFGEPIRTFIEKRLELTMLIAVMSVVLGFVLIRYAF